MTLTAVQILKTVAEAVLRMVSAVCVGIAVAEGKVRAAWQQLEETLFGVLRDVYKTTQLPEIPKLSPRANSYHEGNGLTLSLIAQSIQPRAPNF